MPRRIVVAGMAGHGAGPAAGLHPAGVAALAASDLVVGGRRHLAAVAAAGLLDPATPTRPIEADVDAVVDQIAAEVGVVCVLASGDPGFFGILRPLAARFPAPLLEVHPAPSSVSLAFARLGRPWDDVVVVSAHGRPVSEAAARASAHPRVAVLVSPDAPPEALGKELLRLGAGHPTVAVCARLGLEGERVDLVDLPGLAAGTWDPLSVVVLLDAPGPPPRRSLAWGLAEADFDHRPGMITKGEVRAVALGKLDLPPAGVLWDLGAGSGSIAVECARLAPGLEVVAVERRADDAARIATNAGSHGVRVRVVEGEAPAALAGLADPDRVFVGGGGLAVLDAALARLRPGGRVVATYAALDRAAAAADRLGRLVQVAVSRGERLPDGGLRLVAANPVFVVWGPDPEPGMPGANG